ncbi:aspartic peptidase domain-containing protein [Aspergillus oleicola]
MRNFLLSSLAALAVVPGLCSLSLHQSDSPHVLKLGLRRNRHNDPINRDRRRFKRQSGIVDVELVGDSHGGDIYSTNLTLGNPPQRVEVSVDTGSSDLWVLNTYNRVCSAQGARCDSLGTYDPTSSDSAEALDDQFSIEYGDTSSAEGYYAVDTLTIEGAEIPEAQFGVAIQSNIDKGILGIGYSTNVRSRTVYPNLPELLVRNNITASNAYSLWLNHLGSDEGTVLFGGVNKAHYTGELQTLPVVPYDEDTDSYTHLWLTLTEVGVESEDDDIEKQFQAEPLVALLDSGSTLTYLPSDLVQQIYNDLDVHFFEPEQFGYVPCNTYVSGRTDYAVTFTFSGATIRVPLSELVLRDAMAYAGDTFDINGEESCLFGILPAADFFPILGDTFLRSAYVVFDLDNNEISLAQANRDPDPGDDEIVEIGNGDDPVPGSDDVDMQSVVTTAVVSTAGTSLTLPSGWTNSPIFPSRTVTSSVEAEATETETGESGSDEESGSGAIETGSPAGSDDVDGNEEGGESTSTSVPEQTGSDSETESDTDTDTGGALSVRWDPVLLSLGLGVGTVVFVLGL